MVQGRNDAWFAVKSFGYGVSRPITWQGWAIILAYVALVVLTAIFLVPLASIAIMALATPLLLWIAYVRSDGEWRWRNGEQD
jgi:hypothetical protein